MYFFILQTSVYYLNVVVPSGFEVNQQRMMCCNQWLQIGYRIFYDASGILKCVVYVDEKSIISAYYHEKLKSDARIGMGKVCRLKK